MNPLKHNPFSDLGGIFHGKAAAAESAKREAAEAAARAEQKKAWQAEREQQRPEYLRRARERLAANVTPEMRFENYRESLFSDFPPKTFETLLPGLKSFGAIRRGAGTEERLLVVLTPEEDKPVTRDFKGYYELTLRPDGTFDGEIPESLAAQGLTKELLTDELLRVVELFKPQFWIYKSVAQPTEAGEAWKTGSGAGTEQLVGRDALERVAFLNSIDGAAFGVVVEGGGFPDYYLVVFGDGFAVLENPEIGNAVYIFDGIPRTDENMVVAEKDAYFEKNLRPLVAQRKRAARSSGAVRVRHLGEWQDAVREQIRTIREKKRPQA